MKTQQIDSVLKLESDLSLEFLSGKQVVSISNHQLEKLQEIDLTAVENIDSAGLAQLAQWKTINNRISFVGYSKKIMLLSRLYGLDFLFK
ncbi:MAG TPA: hypothetical protein EYH12_02455 [Psychromonas hadalis]|nr:hypothetical protein [Psychromonas hadalis]